MMWLFCFWVWTFSLNVDLVAFSVCFYSCIRIKNIMSWSLFSERFLPIWLVSGDHCLLWGFWLTWKGSLFNLLHVPLGGGSLNSLLTYCWGNCHLLFHIPLRRLLSFLLCILKWKIAGETWCTCEMWNLQHRVSIKELKSSLRLDLVQYGQLFAWSNSD